VPVLPGLGIEAVTGNAVVREEFADEAEAMDMDIETFIVLIVYDEAIRCQGYEGDACPKYGFSQ